MSSKNSTAPNQHPQVVNTALLVPGLQPAPLSLPSHPPPMPCSVQVFSNLLANPLGPDVVGLDVSELGAKGFDCLTG